MSVSDTDFSHDVVLVTGAARGLGRAIALAFAQAGAVVASGDIRPQEPGGHHRVHPYLLDVADESSVTQAVANIEQDLGPVSVLVNNAGICGTQSITELSLAQWQQTLAVNLTGAFLCSKAVMGGMIRRRRGKIINIGSLAGRCGGILVSADYAASKAGLAGLTKALARQLAKDHVNVNCIAPGTLETELIAAWPPAQVETLRAGMPWGRMGSVEDVTGAVLFLASPAADYITGVTLDINGGLYIAP